MPAFLLAFLKSRFGIASIVGAVSLLALGGLWAYERVEIALKNHEISVRDDLIGKDNDTIMALRRDNATLAGNARDLQKALDDQNAAVLKLQADGLARQAAADAALKQLASARATAKTLADQIVMRLPPPGVDVCVAALDAARHPDQ